MSRKKHKKPEVWQTTRIQWDELMTAVQKYAANKQHGKHMKKGVAFVADLEWEFYTKDKHAWS